MQLKNGIKEMSQKEKLLKRIMKLPKDFTFEELIKLFSALGFELSSKGKTSGSRVKFHNQEKEMQYLAHRPHPSSIIKEKALKDIVDFIIENKLSL
ncbi:type II toxin-antitoxin system HicA family toxin [Petrimonas sp.]|uniref:type II toxin-antitoxin system HicA family toxin n=1 Tax=Petrimonas sp. TaxID=2023866 RepID=UPI003F512FCF